MKTIGILLFIVAGCCHGLVDICPGGEVKKVFGDCVKQHGGNKALITDWIAHKNAEDDNSKCFRTCAMKNCGWFDANGKLKKEVPERSAYALYGGDASKIPQIMEAGKKCLDTIQYDEKNMCNSGENFSRCIMGNCKKCSLNLSAAL
ncbi:general odorant-binding protein 28a-like [Musca domestica]|uniref:General odorant-binding protein 28a-like n=1 Tax=Musca domestica TaxID=7370 RepID=A0ABM3UXV5_MUSDO|nr:general odorant-binding protein 28a-like [Musca domestica]